MTDNMQVAKTLLDVVGGKPRVIEYKDNNNVSAIDIFIGNDRPKEGVTTYSTIGLSAFPIGIKAEKHVRVEFIGACYSNTDKFANIISSCAFNIINSSFSCKPGMAYPNVVKEYYPNSNMKHIFFTTPYLWDSVLRLEFDQAVVTWLMAVPISQDEFDYLKTEGSDALVKLFVDKNINVFDINRAVVSI